MSVTIPAQPGPHWPDSRRPGRGRVSFAGGENDTSVVYALAADGSLFRIDSTSATTFKSVSGVPANLLGTQGWYDLVVAVDPSSAETIYLAGSAALDATNTTYNLTLNKCTVVGGATATPSLNATFVGTGIHSDGHALGFATNADGTHDPSIVWVGTDGGPFASTSGGADTTFAPRNVGLNITQLYALAQRLDTDSVVYGGCQDNGSIRFWGEPAWFEAPQGDGGGVAIDPNNPLRIMRQYTNAALDSATDGGLDATSWSRLAAFPPTPVQGGANIESSRTGFYAPLTTSPSGSPPTLLAFGTNRLWLTPDWGATWTTLPTNTNPYSGATNLSQDVLDDTAPTVAFNPANPASFGLAPVTAIRFASTTTIFAATAKNVWRFDQSGGSWTNAKVTGSVTNLPGNPITAIAVEDAGAGTLYATLGGANVDHVWFFDGTNWQSAGLAAATLDSPVHAIVLDPADNTTIYIGSDVGVWKGVKSGGTWNWVIFSQGLPETAILDLVIHPGARLLRAATHGRGIWEISINATTGQDPDIYVRTNYADSGRLVGGHRFPWVDNVPDPTAPTTNVVHSASADIKVQRSSGATVPVPQDYVGFAGLPNPLNIADVTGINQVFVQVHNRSLMPVAAADLQILLLVANATGGIPALPADYAARITSSDTSNWLGSTGWKFADSANPYRNPAGDLSVRTPQVVEYDADLTALGVTGTQLCAALFVSTAADALSSAETNLDTLVLQDKHVAYRLIQVAGGTAGPAVAGINPTSGSASGGDSVTITGTGFTGATAVNFGGTAATSMSVDSDTQITATSPAGTGMVDVTVVTPGGTSATSAADQFTYNAAGPTVTGINPTSGSASGGDSVTITGTASPGRQRSTLAAPLRLR